MRARIAALTARAEKAEADYKAALLNSAQIVKGYSSMRENLEAERDALKGLLSEISGMFPLASVAGAGDMENAQIARLPQRIYALKADVNNLNTMLRQHGYGQGEITAFVDQCEEVEKLKAENAELREKLRWKKWPEEKPATQGYYLTKQCYKGGRPSPPRTEFWCGAEWEYPAEYITHWREITGPEE